MKKLLFILALFSLGLLSGCGKASSLVSDTPLSSANFTPLSIEESAEWDTLNDSDSQEDAFNTSASNPVPTHSIKNIQLNNITYPVNDGILIYDNTRYSIKYARTDFIAFEETTTSNTFKLIQIIKARRSVTETFATQTVERTPTSNEYTLRHATANATITYYKTRTDRAGTSASNYAGTVILKDAILNGTTSQAHLIVKLPKSTYTARLIGDNSQLNFNAPLFNGKNKQIGMLKMTKNKDQLTILEIQKPNAQGILKTVTTLRPGFSY